MEIKFMRSCFHRTLEWLGVKLHGEALKSFQTLNIYVILFGISFNVFKRIGVSVKKETLVNFLIDPLKMRSTLRPTNVLVYDRVRGKHACVYLTGVYSLMGLTIENFNLGQTTFKATSSNVIKHERTFSDNQYAFISFAVDIF
jgi:hypothetical protein